MPQTTNHRLFFYGTLRHPPLCQRLLGRALPTTSATAPGYRAAPIAGQVYPGLVADPSGRSPGVVVFVSSEERLVLDRFEGPGYQRATIEVDAGASGLVTAETFLLGDATLAAAGHWNFEAFIASAADGFVAGSTAGEVHPRGTGHN